MFRYLVRRTLWAAFLFLAITLVTYVIFFLAPANPERLMCGGERARTECLEQARESLKLDDPILIQYGHFLWRLVGEQSLGESFITKQSVNEIIAKAAPVTASIIFVGILISLAIGVGAGIYSALKPRSLGDRASMAFVLIAVSAHPVWLALLLSFFVGYKLGWTPITGYCDVINPGPGSNCGGFVDWAHHMILPWTAIGLLGAAYYVRMVRANVMETLGEDYVRTARSKGAPDGRVLRVHVLRNALLPLVTMVGMDIGLSLSGALFTETVFSLPGLGNIAITAVNNYDLPIVMGVVVFATLAIVVFNLIVDILYGWIDPRIRVS